MTIETWMAFCAASLAFILLPGPLASLVARYALHRGRLTALVTVPAVSLGLAAAFAVAMLPVAALATILPGATGPLAWLGLVYLMLYAVCPSRSLRPAGRVRPTTISRNSGGSGSSSICSRFRSGRDAMLRLSPPLASSLPAPRPAISPC